MPPCELHVIAYFLQQHRDEGEAIDFFQHYQSRGWRATDGLPIVNWKRLAWTWIWYGSVKNKRVKAAVNF